LGGGATALRSIVSGGCRVAGLVERSVLSQGCSIGAGAAIESSVVLPNATIGRDCRIRRAIVESGCTIPDGLDLGDDLYAAAELCRFSAEGVALITREAVERAAQGHAAPPKVARLSRR
jgi:glucose-1-phosphate adenylyltransferase